MDRKIEWSQWRDPAERIRMWGYIFISMTAVGKWWLEFTRNLIVVAVLWWLAGKSELWYLQLFAYLALGALLINVGGTVLHLYSKLPGMDEPVSTRPIAVLIGFVSAVALGLGVVFGGRHLLDLIIEIARLQTR